MEYMNLGKTGLKVSRICLGMMSYGSPEWRDWVLDESAARPFIQRAIELGINFFDTADMYSLGVSEEVTGKLLTEFASRQEIVLATKVYFPVGKGPNGGGLSRKHIMEAIDDSLRRLGTDYVDLYQIHRWDYSTPIEETMEALHDVVKAGKALYIGASSMYAWQFAKAQHVADLHGWTRFSAMQNHMNAVYREEEREMLPLCQDQGVGVIPWSPLARGFLAGNRKREESDPTARAKSDGFAKDMYYQPEDYDVVDAVVAIAEERGYSPAQIALAWLLHKPGVTSPIIGATKMYQLEEAVAAAEISLSEEEIQRIEAPYRPHPILGHQ
ncbi:aldo/keto reductase [Candidatus Leptofilum sp.]|uniref:aldo/keto reductase n=1 Tax=Candidatus Leptofilum sp. TaxID=3241576 RepID=UPI003B5AE8CF